MDVKLYDRGVAILVTGVDEPGAVFAPAFGSQRAHIEDALRRIPSGLIVQHLHRIAEQESVAVEDAALHAIARGADGGMRDAESTLDQLISFCGERIEENDVLSMFGLAAQGRILELSRAILAGEIETVLRELNGLAQQGKDLGRLLADLLRHFRNLLIFRVARGDTALLELSEAETASLSEQAAGAGTEALTRIMEVLTDCEVRLRDATSRKILIEVALLKAIEARNALSIDTVLQQLRSLRDGSRGDGGALSLADASSGSSREPAPGSESPGAATSGPGKKRTVPERAAAADRALPATDLESLWQQIVEAVGRASPFTRSYLLEAHPVSFKDGLLTIGFDPEFSDHLELIDNPKSRTLLQTKLSELGFSDAQVKFIQAESPAERRAPAPGAMPPASKVTPAAPASAGKAAETPPAKAKPEPVPFNKEEFKNDPLIRKALEVFKGEIVEVRA